MKCKICGGEIVMQCKCLRNDVTCENGHSYHYSPYHKEYHEGLSDHSTDVFSPNCCEDKRKIGGIGMTDKERLEDIEAKYSTLTVSSEKNSTEYTEVDVEDLVFLIQNGFKQAEQLEKVNKYQRIYIVRNNTEETKEIVLVTHNREKALSYIVQKGYTISGHTPED